MGEPLLGVLANVAPYMSIVSALRSSRQHDLSPAPLPHGLTMEEEAITQDEERRLIAMIDHAPLAPFRFQGWTGKRLTHSFGWHYDLDDARFGPTEPMPHVLLPIRARAAAFAGPAADDLVQVLVIRYDPGAGIGWHRDRPVFEHVVGLSLGSAATMRFRCRSDSGFDRIAVELPPRSIYHLTCEARHRWQHSIPEVAQARWSLTFRSLSAKGLGAFTAARAHVG